MSLGGSYFLVALIWILISIIVIYLLHFFGDKKTFAWYTWATTFVSYFIAFTIIIMLPIDIASVSLSYHLSINQSTEGKVITKLHFISLLQITFHMYHYCKLQITCYSSVYKI
jgi:hypothetical protein